MPIRRHLGDGHKRDPAAQTVWPEPGKYRGEFDDDGDDDDVDDDMGRAKGWSSWLNLCNGHLP